MSKKIQNDDKFRKLIRLQKDYLVKAITSLDEFLVMAKELEKMEDPILIESYLNKMKEIESNIDSDYDTACKIERSMS